MNKAANLLSSKLWKLLFLLIFLIMLIPIFAAFFSIFDGGIINNLKRALSNKRFINSFSYGLKQASLSAIVALIFGLPGAFFYAKRNFVGRKILSVLSAIPFCMPPLVIALGFVLFYGQEGFINKALKHIFLLNKAPVNFLYSFWGVVLTHSLYNFPLVIKIVGGAWANCPKKHEDAAKLLEKSKKRIFFTITFPQILPALGAALSLIFLMCFYSFVIVLLFGGPGAGTPEVELYHAARLEVDYSLASTFALFETTIAMLVLLIYSFFSSKISTDIKDFEKSNRTNLKRTEIFPLILYGLFILIFLIGPLISIVIESFSITTRGRTYGGLGIENYINLFSKRSFTQAIFNSFILASLCGIFSVIIGFCLSVGLKNVKSQALSKIFPMLPLGISGIVLTYGWTQIIGSSSVFIIALVQAISAYPFSLRAVQVSVGLSDNKYIEAAKTLGSNNISSILRVSLPLALPALSSGFVLSFAISLGDANALIVSPVNGFNTASLILYQLASSYRFNEACAASVIIGILSIFVFMLREKKYGQ